jgi:hypothetical protein
MAAIRPHYARFTRRALWGGGLALWLFVAGGVLLAHRFAPVVYVQPGT